MDQNGKRRDCSTTAEVFMPTAVSLAAREHLPGRPKMFIDHLYQCGWTARSIAEK